MLRPSGLIPRGPFALEVLSLEAFRCEFMGHNWGVPAEFLCYNTPYTYHEAMAFTLLHDVLVRNDLDEESRLWKAMDAFGRKAATWLPYWENAAYVTTESKEVKVSLYNRPGRGVLAVVSNLGQRDCEARVNLNLAALRQPSALAASEVMSGKPVAVTDGRLRLPLGSLDFAVVWLKPR